MKLMTRVNLSVKSSTKLTPRLSLGFSCSSSRRAVYQHQYHQRRPLPLNIERQRVVALSSPSPSSSPSSSSSSSSSSDDFKPTDRTQQSKDPRYKVRTTYKRGLEWFKFQVLQTFLGLKLVQVAIREWKSFAEKAFVFWTQNKTVQPLRSLCEGFARAVLASVEEYRKFSLKRCQKKYLWELASKKEAEAMKDVGRFFLGFILMVVWQVLTPWSSFFWSLVLPLGFGYLRSIRPLGVPNRPFPWPVIVGFLVMVPLKFGDAIESFAMGSSYITAGFAGQVVLLVALTGLMWKCRNLTYNMRWADQFLRFLDGVKRERVDGLWK